MYHAFCINPTATKQSTEKISFMSNITIGERIRLIREAEHLGRQRFCKKINQNIGSLVNTENNADSCNSQILVAICRHFPKYAEFLLTGKNSDFTIQQAPNPDDVNDFRRQIEKKMSIRRPDIY